MNLSAAYLAIVAFSTFPRLVRGTEWIRLSLLDDLLPEAEEHPPMSFPSINFMDPFYESSSSLSSMIRRQQQMMEDFDNTFFRGGPAFRLMSSPATTTTSTSIFRPQVLQPQPAISSVQVTNDSNHFEVTITQLPSGLSPGDLQVDFDESTRQLTIGGQYEFTNDETSYRSVSKFSRSFSLDPFVKVDQLKATIDTDTNVLTVSAPKNLEKMEHSLRSIPVMMNTNQEQEEQPQKVVLEIKRSSSGEEEEEEPSELSPPEAIRAKSNEEEEEELYNDSFDPFHIKERVQKSLSFRQQQNNSNEANSSNLLDDTMSGFKTSELRRRLRRN